MQVYARFALISVLVCFAGAAVADKTTQSTALVEQLWSSCGVQDDRLNEVIEALDVDRFSLKADEIVRVNSEVSNLSGNVLLTGPGFKVTTDGVQFDEVDKVVRTADVVNFVHRDIVATGSNTELFVEQVAANLTDARLYLPGSGFRGVAAAIRLDENEIVLEDAGLTTCNPDSAGWYLSTKQIRVDREKQLAVARDIKLKLGDVPVVFFPYLRFPATDKRLSGMLMPSIARSSEDGFKTKVPIYLNLAPNYDLTLSPSVTSRRGTKIEGEFRHISMSMRNSSKFLYSPADQRYAKELQIREVAGVASELSDRRWRFNVEHEGVYQKWRSTINMEASSDELLARDVGRSIFDITSVGASEVAALNRLSSNSQFRVDIHEFQPYDDWSSVHRITPRVASWWKRRLGPLDFKIYGSLASIMSRTTNTEESARRAHTEFSVVAPLRRNWGFLEFDGTQRNSRYEFDDVSASRSITSFSLSGGLVFERSFGFRDGLALQTLEPRFLIENWNVGNQDDLPNFDSVEIRPSFENIFEARQYTGYDRYADNDGVSIGVVSRLLPLSNAMEQLNLSFAVRQPFGDSKKVDNQIRRAGIGLQTSIVPNLAVEGFLLSPRYKEGNSESAMRTRFHSASDQGDYELVLGARSSGDARQYELTASKRLTERWRAYLHSYWNQHQNQNIESFFGVEYSGCCLQIRVMWRETIYPSFRFTETTTRNRGLLIEFSLLGLGSIGDEVASILDWQFSS